MPTDEDIQEWGSDMGDYLGKERYLKAFDKADKEWIEREDRTVHYRDFIRKALENA